MNNYGKIMNYYLYKLHQQQRCLIVLSFVLTNENNDGISTSTNLPTDAINPIQNKNKDFPVTILITTACQVTREECVTAPDNATGKLFLIQHTRAKLVEKYGGKEESLNSTDKQWYNLHIKRLSKYLVSCFDDNILLSIDTYRSKFTPSSIKCVCSNNTAQFSIFSLCNILNLTF